MNVQEIREQLEREWDNPPPPPPPEPEVIRGGEITNDSNTIWENYVRHVTGDQAEETKVENNKNMMVRLGVPFASVSKHAM